MRDYNPRYDMPPRIDRWINKHPRFFAIAVMVIICAALALVGAIQ